MKRALFTLLLSATIAVPVYADVTIKQTTTGKGLGMSGTSTVTQQIKGGKMRTDVVMGDSTRTTIFDVDAQKMYSFDAKKKEVDVWDMVALSAEVTKNTNLSAMTASLTANSKTKEIAGKKADGYDMAISMPAKIGGGEMTMTVNLAGPVWIVKGAPGSADWIRFYTQASEKGWIFTDPRAAKAGPGQAKALAQMYREMAKAGGIAYESEVDIKISGDGPMAAILAKMGGAQLTSTVTEVTEGALADTLFAIPTGYALKERK